MDESLSGRLESGQAHAYCVLVTSFPSHSEHGLLPTQIHCAIMSTKNP